VSKTDDENPHITAALKATITKVGSSSQDDFPKFLRTLLNGRTTDWKTAKTAEDALVCHQVVLDAMKHLEDLGWAKTGGGYQIPEGMCQLQCKNATLTFLK
jgi:hypothetical protein